MNTAAVLALLGNLYEQVVALQQENAALQQENARLKEMLGASAPDAAQAAP